MEARIDHPPDSDLQEYTRDASAGPQAAEILGHLRACLLCRIRIARIRRNDLARAASPLEIAHPNTWPKILAAINSAQHPNSFSPGQVWLAGSDPRMLVWIRAVLAKAVSVYAVTLDIDAADEKSLIVDEFEAIGHPVTIMSSVIGTVPIEQLSGYLGDLDIQPELERISGSASTGQDHGLRTGSPITSQADERIVLRQILADELASLDPIEDDDDDDEDFDPISAAAAIMDTLVNELPSLRGNSLRIHRPQSFAHLLTMPMGCLPVACVEEFGCTAIVMAAEDPSTWPSAMNSVAHAAKFLSAVSADALAIANSKFPFDAAVFEKQDLHYAYEPPHADTMLEPRVARETQPLIKALVNLLDQSAFAVAESPMPSPAGTGFELAPPMREHAADAIERLSTTGAQLTKREALRALSRADAAAIAEALASSTTSEELIALLDAIAER